ncbi:MAG: hypothetical protein GY714_05915 [Desulfobacterales bacterium]|nr:hypothetical protein [Desulfobacterales bacterium]
MSLDIIDNKRFLRIPLYKLIYIEDLKSFNGLSNSELLEFEREYSSEERKKIIESLRWGANNNGFDFTSLLEGLSYSNESIYDYICILYNQLNDK